MVYIIYSAIYILFYLFICNLKTIFTMVKIFLWLCGKTLATREAGANHDLCQPVIYFVKYMTRISPKFRKRNRYVLKVELYYVYSILEQKLPLCLTVRELYLASSMSAPQYSTASQAQPFESGRLFINPCIPWLEKWNRYLQPLSNAGAIQSCVP